MNNRLINTKVAGGGGGCTDIVDNYDPFGGSGVALYQLNGDATDVSGNYNGTASNVTYGTGVFGQAGVFNGSNSRINNNSISISLGSEFSISLWIKSGLDNTWQTILEFGSTVNDTLQIQKRGDNNKFRFIDQNSGVAIFDIDTSVATINQWFHYAVSVSSNSYSVYENGSYVDGGTYSHTETHTSLALGYRQSNNLEHFNGSLDQVRIFNTALTPLEVEALYTEELCICDGTVDTLDILGDGSCIATYPLDGNANDLSGNYSGTPTNVSYGVGEFDLAGVFNGSGSYILANGLQSLYNSNQTSSISFWFKTTTAEAQEDYMFIDYSGYHNYAIAIKNSKVFVNTRVDGNGAGDVIFNSTANYNDGNWHHLVVSKNNSTLQRTIYIDNQLLSTQTILATAWSATPQVSFGCLFVPPSTVLYPFNGSIDQVRIFNKALSAGEVTTLYNETACTPPIVENCFDVTSLVYFGKNATGIKTALGGLGTTWARCMKFSPDGSILFISQWYSNSNFNSTVSGLDLSIPYDITTWSYNSNRYNFGAGLSGIFGFEFNPDGTKIFVTQNRVLTEYSLSIPFDLTTTSAAINSFDFSSSMTGTELYQVQFNNDGTKLLISNSQNIIFEYSLSTPYSLSSVTYTQQSTALNEPVANAIIHATFTPDGSRILAKRTGGQIIARDFSTPFDVSTMSSIIATNSSSPMGASYDPIAYNSTGTIAVGFNADILYSLNMCY